MSNEEWLDLHKEVLDAGVSGGPTYAELEEDIARIKERALPLSRSRSVLEYRKLLLGIYENSLKAWRAGITAGRWRDLQLAAVSKFAGSHSLEEMTSEESKQSDALKLFWKVIQWQRKEAKEN